MKIMGYILLLISFLSCKPTSKEVGDENIATDTPKLQSQNIQSSIPASQTKKAAAIYVIDDDFTELLPQWNINSGEFQIKTGQLRSTKANSEIEQALVLTEGKIQVKALHSDSFSWGIKLYTSEGLWKLQLTQDTLSLKTPEEKIPPIPLKITDRDIILTLYFYQNLLDVFIQDQLILSCSKKGSLTSLSLWSARQGDAFEYIKAQDFNLMDPTITFNAPPNSPKEFSINAYRLYANGTPVPISSQTASDYVGFHLYPGYSYYFSDENNHTWLYLPHQEVKDFYLGDSVYSLDNRITELKNKLQEIDKSLSESAPFNTKDLQDPNYLAYLQQLEIKEKQYRQYLQLQIYQARIQELGVSICWSPITDENPDIENFDTWGEGAFADLLDRAKSTILANILRNRLRERLALVQPREDLETLLLDQIETLPLDMTPLKAVFLTDLLHQLQNHSQLPGNIMVLPEYAMLIDRFPLYKTITDEIWINRGFQSLVDSRCMEILNKMGAMDSAMSLDQSISLWIKQQSGRDKVKLSRKVVLYLQEYQDLVNQLEQIITNPDLATGIKKEKAAKLIARLEEQQFEGDRLIEEKRMHAPGEFTLIEEKLEPINQQYGEVLQLINNQRLWNSNVGTLEKEIQMLIDPEAKEFLMDFIPFLEKYKNYKAEYNLDNLTNSNIIKEMERDFNERMERDNSIFVRLYENSHPDFDTYNSIAQVLREDFIQAISQ